MATKKPKTQKPKLSLTAKIDRMIDREDAKVKAYASINIGGEFVIKDIAVVDGQKRTVRKNALSLIQKFGRRNQVFGHCLCHNRFGKAQHRGRRYRRLP